MTDNKNILMNRDQFPKVEIGIAVAAILISLSMVVWSLWHAVSSMTAIFAIFVSLFVVDVMSYLIHYMFDTWDFEWNAQLKIIAADFKSHHFDYTRVVRNGPFRNGAIWLSLYLVLPELLLSRQFPQGDFWSIFMTSQAFFSSLVPDVHRMAHHVRRPRWVRQLQNLKIIISPQLHRRHHPGKLQDHRNDWSLFNGWANPVLNPFLSSTPFWRPVARSSRKR